MSRALIAAMLVLASVGTASAQARNQVNWRPNRYRVHCTLSDKSKCMHGLHGQIEGTLQDASTRYKALGWKAVKNFGPVLSKNMQEFVKVEEVGADKYAYATPGCGSTPHSTISFGAKTAKIESEPQIVYFFVAHELFHIIQYGFRAFRGTGCGPRYAGWITEATATDLALVLARQYFPSGYFPVRPFVGLDGDQNDRLMRTFSGLRRYDVPLTYRREVHTNQIEHYRTQSFWRHLAEVHHGGSRAFLKRYFGRKPRIKHDYLEWLHDNLRFDLGIALGPVYTMFLADYAGWGAKGRPGQVFGEKKWLKEAFGGCTQVRLSPTSPSVLLDMELLRVSGKCVDVKVEGLENGQRVTIKAAAIDNAMRRADQLNLGLAKARGTRSFECASGLRSKSRKRRLESQNRCRFLGNNGYLKMGGKQYWARVWEVFAQYPKNGKIDNRYVITRVATSPTDFPKNDGGAKLSFKLAFAADFSSKKIAGQASSKKTVAHLNEQSVHKAQEHVPRFNKRGGEATSMLYPHAPKRQVIPPVPIELRGQSNKSGIWMLRVSDVSVKNDGFFTESLTPEDWLAVYPTSDDGNAPRPLQVGDTGSFSAIITGKRGWRGVYTKNPATLKVDEFTAYALRARVTGTLCDAPLNRQDRKSNRCVNPRSVSLEISKGLAGWNHPSQKYVVWDSPGTRQLKAHVGKLMSLYMGPGSPGAGGGGGSSGSSGGSGGGATNKYKVKGPYSSKVHMVGRCQCTCNDQHYLKKLQADLKSGRDKENSAMLRIVMKLGRCMRSCTPYYIGTCSKQKKR